MQQLPSMDTIDLAAAVLYTVEFLSAPPGRRPANPDERSRGYIQGFLRFRHLLREQVELAARWSRQSDAPQDPWRPDRG